MPKHIINQLVIAAGQWQRFREPQYEKQFESLLNDLQTTTGLSRNRAVDLLIKEL